MAEWGEVVILWQGNRGRKMGAEEMEGMGDGRRELEKVGFQLWRGYS